MRSPGEHVIVFDAALGQKAVHGRVGLQVKVPGHDARVPDHDGAAVTAVGGGVDLGAEALEFRD